MSMPNAASPWIEPFAFSSAWGSLLSGAGAWIFPGLLFVAGLAVAGAIVYAYRQPDLLPAPFFGLQVPEIPGLDKKYVIWAPFVASSLFCLVLILGAFGMATSGSGGMAFSHAASQLDSISQAVSSSCETEVLRISAKVQSDLDALNTQCPAAIKQVLGDSVTNAQGDVRKAESDVQAAAEALKGFPELLGQLATHINSFSGFNAVFTAIALLSALACCVVIGVQLGATRNAAMSRVLNKQIGPSYLGWLSPALAAAAAFLLASAGACELSAAAKAASFCGGEGGPDAATLDLFETDGSATSLASHYIGGQGNNPAIMAMVEAKEALNACKTWLVKYTPAMQTTCPQWGATAVMSDIKLMENSLNRTESVLQPDVLYGQYEEAVHGTTCNDGTSGLASLAFQQFFLGCLGLPLLVLSATWLQDALSKDGAAFSKLGQDETAAAKSRDHHGSDSEGAEEEDFNVLYYVVYAFSVVVFAIGTFMYVIPQPGLVRPATGTLLFACGIFLMMNSDLIVTYARLHEQVGKFKANNDRFDQSLQKQGSEVRRLQTAAKGLDEIDRKFGGSVKRAMKEVKQLETSARANIGMSCKELCGLYFDKDRNREIGAGQELKDALETLTTIFGAIVRDLRSTRIPKLQQGLEGHKRFQQEKSLSVSIFTEAFECALFAHDPDQIPQAVSQVLDRAQGSGKGGPTAATAA